MLNLRYDPAARAGYVRLRDGKAVRSRRLSQHATAEYGRRGQLLAISIEDLDATAAEFLRNADEETLLRVIAAQAGSAKVGTPSPERPPAARPRRGKERR